MESDRVFCTYKKKKNKIKYLLVFESWIREENVYLWWCRGTLHWKIMLEKWGKFDMILLSWLCNVPLCECFCDFVWVILRCGTYIHDTEISYIQHLLSILACFCAFIYVVGWRIYYVHNIFFVLPKKKKEENRVGV